MRLRSIWLVARREILERGRSRGYLLSLGFTVFILVAAFLAPVLLASQSGPLKLGVIEPAPGGLQPALLAAAAAVDEDLEVEIQAFPDRAAAAAAIEAGDVVAVFSVPADLSGPGEVLVQERAGADVQLIATRAIPALRIGALLDGTDVSPAELGEASRQPELTALEPPSDEEMAQFLIANVGVILMFIGIFSYGFWVLGGVVEEKQSRVVEVVLSTVRARDLLMGKVFGIGILGIGQLAILVGASLLAATITDRFTLPATTGSAIAMLVFWFVLGFALYATALGFLGALASRMEEAQNAAMPVTMVATASYIVALLVATDDPGGIIARVATFLPPSAPMIVPLRAALGEIEAWEIAVSAVVTVVAIWVLFNVGARIYSGAVLSLGGQVRLRDAWRASED
jgi:ABC-2 type transport system permease protein